MYNKAVNTVYHELSGPSNYQLLPAGNKWIVGVSIQQSGTASTSEIQCGTTTFVKNFGKDFPFNQLSYYCPSAINITKTGQDSATYILSYVPEQLYQTSTPSFEIATNSATALGNSIYLIWLCFGILILLQAIGIGTYIYKK
jgi:hypothetical protein